MALKKIAKRFASIKSSNLLPVVLMVLLTGLILWGGRAKPPKEDLQVPEPPKEIQPQPKKYVIPKPADSVVSNVYVSPARKSVDGKVRVFAVELPEGWTIEEHNVGAVIYDVYFKKGKSSIVIRDVFESSYCVFPEYEEWDERLGIIEHYGYISTNFGRYRIAKEPGMYQDNDLISTLRLCEDIGVSEDAYTTSPWYDQTKIGMITFLINNNELPVKEMEDIVRSIKVIDF